MKANHLLAASVMTGCAAEKAMILLIEGFGNAITDAAAKTSYEKATKSRMIKNKYVALWDRIQKPAVQAQLPANVKDDLHTLLDRVFDLIRTTRNEAGHPTGKTIEKETVHANFLLFPSYCKRVYGLMAFFAGTAPAL